MDNPGVYEAHRIVSKEEMKRTIDNLGPNDYAYLYVAEQRKNGQYGNFGMFYPVLDAVQKLGVRLAAITLLNHNQHL